MRDKTLFNSFIASIKNLDFVIFFFFFGIVEAGYVRNLSLSAREKENFNVLEAASRLSTMLSEAMNFHTYIELLYKRPFSVQHWIHSITDRFHSRRVVEDVTIRNSKHESLRDGEKKLKKKKRFGLIAKCGSSS